jgi:hypothetical protein
MGSIRRFLDEMNKQASAPNPADGEAAGFNDILAKVAFLKMAQEAAVAEALGEVPVEEAGPPMDEAALLGGEGDVGGEGAPMDEEAISEALSEIIDNLDQLEDPDKEAILEAADQLENTEAAAGEKTASVMDYVRLLNWLNIK